MPISDLCSCIEIFIRVIRNNLYSDSAREAKATHRRLRFRVSQVNRELQKVGNVNPGNRYMPWYLDVYSSVTSRYALGVRLCSAPTLKVSLTTGGDRASVIISWGESSLSAVFVINDILPYLLTLLVPSK